MMKIKPCILSKIIFSGLITLINPFLLGQVPDEEEINQGILREVWPNTTGSHLRYLYENPNYPSNPVVSEILPNFDTPRNWSNKYGTRLRGYLQPVESGHYTFWISGDDRCELYLSEDSDEVNAKLIASVPGYTSQYQWEKYDAQKSIEIYLEAEKNYYIEANHKEGWGGDHVTVAWSNNSNGNPVIIDGSYLIPYSTAALYDPNTKFFIEAGQNREIYLPRNSAVLDGQVLNLNRNKNITVTWSLIEGPTSATIINPEVLNTQISFSETGVYKFQLSVTHEQNILTDEVTITANSALDENVGFVYQDIWLNVRGSYVSSLISSDDYPLTPHLIRKTAKLVGPSRWSNLYGMRTRGYIHAPVSGSYKFWIMGDHEVQLHLSSDETEAGLNLISHSKYPTGYNRWSRYPTQESDSIDLVAGEKYYFEVLHKDSWGNDYHGVAWARENNNPEIVTGEFISPFIDENNPNVIKPNFNPDNLFAVEAGRNIKLFLPQLTASLSGKILLIKQSIEPTQIQWTQLEGPGTAKFENANNFVTAVNFDAAGDYTLELNVTGNGQTISDQLIVSIQSAIAEDTGKISRDIWLDVRGNYLKDLYKNENYPDTPDIADQLTSLEGPTNWSDTYGSRIQGYLHPHSSGYYTFYISGDDETEFKLSQTENPEDATRVSYNQRATRQYDWDRYYTQESEKIWLKSGERYYIELLHKEGWGNDHFAVAWTFEDEKVPEVINGSFISPFKAGHAHRTELKVYANAGIDRSYFWPEDIVKMQGSIRNITRSTIPFDVEWIFTSGSETPEIIEPNNLESLVKFPGPGSYSFRLIITAEGNSHTDEVVITINDALNNETGSVLRSVWLNVDGKMIEDMMENDTKLTNPSFEDLLPGLIAPSNWANFYGTRLVGMITPPSTGEYTFWIASDDHSELWLSDSENPEDKIKIAHLMTRVYPGQWDRHNSQKSEPKLLEAGKKYYLEVLHKEQTGYDHLAVAWDGPGINGREVISKAFLSPLNDAPSHNDAIQVVAGDDLKILFPENKVNVQALVYDLEDGPEPLKYQWSSNSPDNVTFVDASFPATNVLFSAPGTYSLTLTATDSVNSGSDSIDVIVENALAENVGGLLREIWLDVPGYKISDILEDPNYPDSPQLKDLLPSLEAPINWNDNYATRLSGFIVVPENGLYQFFIASDDQSELFLNSNGADVEGKQKIAFTSRATGFHRWNRYDSQSSELIQLKAGEKYYIEVLHKESHYDDYLSIAWKRPNQDELKIITGKYLVPFESVEKVNTELITLAGEDQEWVWPVKSVNLNGYVFDSIPGPLAMSHSWTKESGPGEVTFDVKHDLVTKARFSESGEYILSLTATDGEHTEKDSIKITIYPSLGENTGSILREIYTNISGSQVLDLINSPDYPDSPAARDRINRTETPQDLDDNYGTILRGYIHPPITGSYRFNISSDDWSEVYLSSDDNPENKGIICLVPKWTYYYEWDKYPEYQNSGSITLEAGKRYYIEIRHKESGWRDHLEVAWKIPGSDSMQIIEGGFLSPFILEETEAPTITINGDSEITVKVGETFVDPGVTVIDSNNEDLSDQLNVENFVDTSRAGTYSVRYQVFDEFANSVELVRKVNVVAGDIKPANYLPDQSTNISTEEWQEPDTISTAEAARFLNHATFGATATDIERVQEIGFEAWVDEQLQLTETLHLPLMQKTLGYLEVSMMRLRTEERMYAWWTNAITAPDQLRQRVAFALSQILVLSDHNPALSRYTLGVTNYYDILVRNSTGNYRNLLEEVTLNPMMGIFLTMMRSTKDSPDENYPREVMQLFSIGLPQLNTDGTLKLDANGNSQSTYDLNTILEMSRVMTGWTFSGSKDFFWNRYGEEDVFSSMMPFEQYHDSGEKVLLDGFTIPAGQSAYEDIQSAMDNIFNHPNVGPFIARRLIQRMVTSNPSPEYIYRVASKFNDNGSGVRGDLGAVAKAILLDPEARDMSNLDDVKAGKLSEPIIRLTQLLRPLSKKPTSNPPTLGRYVIRDTERYFGQAPLFARSVFNFYEPDYQVPGKLMTAGLYSPEFQITTEVTAVEASNFFFDTVRNGISASWRQAGRVELDLSNLIDQTNNIDELLDKVNEIIMSGRLTNETREILKTALEPHFDNKEYVVQSVLQLILSSPEFVIQK